MIKKIIISILLMFIMFALSNVFAVTVEQQNILESDTASTLIKIKDNEKGELDDYVKRYGTEAYGLTAYILNKVRLYSIPLCFIGIAVGGIYQYVIGIRRLDVQDRGLTLIILFITVLVIAQVLPLIFALVVKGWRG